MSHINTKEIAYKIVKKKIDQGCEFIVKGEVFADELINDIIKAMTTATISERNRCLSVLDEEGWLGNSRQRIYKGE